MSKIVFIEPRAANLHIFSVFGIPRLGCALLATILQDAGHDTRVYIEEISEIDFSDVLSADLVGISTITSTAPRAYEIARQVRAHGVPVIMGGPHVTFLADEALQNCDFVFRGEAEQSILPFMDAFENGGGYENISGLSYNKGKSAVHNPVAHDWVDLEQNPTPNLDLIANFKANRGLTAKRIIPVQTSRGCPFSCTFCSVTQMFGRRMRYRSIDSVIEELHQYDNKGDFIFFYDDNFAVNLKHTKALLQRMIDEGLKLHWSAQVRIDVYKDKELLRLMRDSGCTNVYIGFETVSDETLSLVKKAQTKIEMMRAIRAIHKHKIGIHGMFVFGFDTDTVKSTRETCKFAMKQKLLSVQYLILTPLPGTATYDQYKQEDRLIIKDWGFYDGHHVVHAPGRMSPVDLQWAQVRAHRRYFSLSERLRSLVRLDIYRAFAQRYARKVSRKWMRANKYYLKAIKLQGRATRAFNKKSTNTVLKIDLRTTYNDIRERIEKALAGLRKPADNPKG
jgi:radical SAM superfamily enzyme YgiQ (UPF0313 family)